MALALHISSGFVIPLGVIALIVGHIAGRYLPVTLESASQDIISGVPGELNCSAEHPGLYLLACRNSTRAVGTMQAQRSSGTIASGEVTIWRLMCEC